MEDSQEQKLVTVLDLDANEMPPFEPGLMANTAICVMIVAVTATSIYREFSLCQRLAKCLALVICLISTATLQSPLRKLRLGGVNNCLGSHASKLWHYDFAPGPANPTAFPRQAVELLSPIHCTP